MKSETLLQVGRQVLKRFDLYSSYLMKASGILQVDGWYRSFVEEASVDAQGMPLPWITYPALEFLRRRISPSMSVFEYGSGGSTLWWAARVHEVISVEHDRDWYEKVSKTAPANATVHFVELDYGGAYASRIGEYPHRFDIVVIDGRDRVNCARNSLLALKPAGVIVWDNSDRVEYEHGYRFLLENGFSKIEFIGLAPICTHKAETSIFYRPGNCLGI